MAKGPSWVALGRDDGRDVWVLGIWDLGLGGGGSSGVFGGVLVGAPLEMGEDWTGGGECAL